MEFGDRADKVVCVGADPTILLITVIGHFASATTTHFHLTLRPLVVQLGFCTSDSRKRKSTPD
jgi:hypothetical protein